jgi:dihydroorotate dehydrogenase electron transfer subunit
MSFVFTEVPIRDVKKISPEVFRLSFSAGVMARQARPGQFLMVRPAKFQEPLLPRPFSTHRRRGNSIEILFKVVGKGTKQMADLKPGDLLEVRGPLGKGFQVDLSKEPVLVAGGMGVAPLLFLAESLHNLPKWPFKFPAKILLGAKTKKELYCLKEFERACVEVLVATEDGSSGQRGLVTDLLKKLFPKKESTISLYTCGPNPMLKAVARWAVQRKVSCQVSLESRMACGLGACLGCVVAKKSQAGISYVNVCQEGPVFQANEIVWDR